MIQTPSSTRVSEVLGSDVIGRQTIRETNLAIVERLHLERAQDETVILKTTAPEMRHESAVHEFASCMDICAARLLGADSRAQYPWLVQEDAGDARTNQQLTHDEVAAVFESLAEFHARAASSPGLAGSVPDRSPSGLVRGIDEAMQVVAPVMREVAADLSHDAFAAGLRRLSTVMNGMPLTVIHGDFDPGNLVTARDGWRALDWGLAHLNTPLADVAHMAMRFATRERLPLVMRYLQAANRAGLDPTTGHTINELLQIGNLAHEAFFAWWHSYCIVELGSDRDELAVNLSGRYRRICQLGGSNSA